MTDQLGTAGAVRSSPHVVVVGGGISGLAAALALRREGPPNLRLTVLDGAPQLGGKLRTSEIAGVLVDEGAETFLARRPEAVELARAVGLGGQLVHPATTDAGLWSRGRLRRLPRRTLLGVPTSVPAVVRAGVLSPAGTARLLLDYALPGAPVEGDVAVGRYVGRRLGPEVVDRLVDPLLGGVYAGRAEALSLSATIPQLAPVAARGGSLLHGAAAVVRGALPSAAAATRRPPQRDAAAARRISLPPETGPLPEPPTPYGGPTFASIRGGLGGLVDAVAGASGAELRPATTARELRRRPEGGWIVVVGPTRAPERLHADAVVLAAPAGPAARLLAAELPAAAAAVATIDYASVAIVTVAYTEVPPLPGSGFLVPPVEGKVVKAVTFSSTKWPQLTAGGPSVVRCSVGRYGETADLRRDDSELVAAVTAELAQLVGLVDPPVASRVTRWGGALPQYAVGHLDLVRRVRTAMAAAAGLAVCGAAYDGVGIPACVASGQRAAAEVLRSLPVATPGASDL